MTSSCEFCEGTGKEPGLDGCVWCQNTGTKEGQKFVDLGKPGSDMTAKATFRNEGGKLTLESIEYVEPVVYAPVKRISLEAARKLYPTQEEPPCPFCFQRGCNGECHGDDMMGDS